MAESSISGIGESSLSGIDESSLYVIDESSLSGIDELSLSGIDESSLSGIDESSLSDIDELSLSGIDELSLSGIDELSLSLIGESSLSLLAESSFPGIGESPLSGLADSLLANIAESSLSGIAESSISGMADSLLANIASSDIEHASQEIGLYHHLQALKESLLSLIAGLREFEQEQEHCIELPEWLKGLKHVLSDAENVVDELKYGTLGKQVFKSKTKVGRFFSSTSNPLAFVHRRMAKQFKQIMERLRVCANQVSAVNRTLVIKSVRISNPYDIDINVIGMEDDKNMIIQLLMHHNPNSLSVLPIVGMGGMGKTTLAKLVYHDTRIEKCFQLKIWVCVSLGFETRRVIHQIIKFFVSVDSDTLVTRYPFLYKYQTLGMVKQINLLRNMLAGQKFLLVLDDVWKKDPLGWNELRNIMLMGAKGSKILVTTRSYSIASMMGTMPSHNLEALSLKDSWSLFEECAFKGEAEKYPDLVMTVREIVNKCGGVPSTIKTLGHKVFSEYKICEQESIRDSAFSDFPEVNHILPALRLNYDYMPSHLKRCFELFSLYPSDFVFNSSEVASLWAALGVLPSLNKDKTWIDVANQCLHELMSRSFLQEFVNFGTSYYFQMHHFVHDLARHIAKDDCLMVNSNVQDIPQNVQHLSFAEDDLLGKSLTQKSDVVRTILFPIEGVGASNEAFLNMCVSRYKYLRILDLSDSTYKTLPWSTSKLRHLRFLSLERNEKIKRVPDSICKLQNLQVLNLVGCTELEKLPKGLSSLISLRQLGITTKESALPENDIANLNSLEILNIESCDNLESFFVGIKLPTLKTLTVTNCGSLKSLPLDINQFPRLDTLLVDNCGDLELANGHDDKNSSLRLKAIRLHSLPQLVNLPCWLQESTNTLQSLLIVDCKNLEVLPEWLSTLSFLGSIGIVNCPKLMSLPNDIHCLICLGYLRIEGCPDLCRKCQRRVGEYWPKISPIKQIFIDELEDLKEESVEEG